MQNIEGLYSSISAFVKESEDENRMVISVDEVVKRVKNEVDIYSATLDYYIDSTINHAVATILNQAGYRSVVKGNGLYVNLDSCENPDVLARLYNNASFSEQQKKQVVEMIKKRIKEVEVSGQFEMDFETGNIIECISEEQLIAILEADAKIS